MELIKLKLVRVRGVFGLFGRGVFVENLKGRQQERADRCAEASVAQR